MIGKDIRPRVTPEINRVVQAMKQGWVPDMSGIPQGESFDKRSPAKILIFDIETAPLKGYLWSIWQEGIGLNQLISDWFMISWSAKWLFEPEVMGDVLTPEEILKEDDERITKGIWELLNEADVVIAHNAKSFDIKKLNSRFILNGLNPPMPYQVIDTLLHARRRFKMSSNKLDYLCKILGLEGKMSTGGFDLWAGCMNGDKESLTKMAMYNDKDVVVLEDCYLKMRAWIKPHPNMGLFIEDEVERCPNCGSDHLTFSGTPYRTQVNAFKAFRCNDCGGVGRSRSNMAKTDDIPRVQTTSIAT